MTETVGRLARRCDVADTIGEKGVAVSASDLRALLAVVEAAQEDLAEHDAALLVAGSGDFYKTRQALLRLHSQASDEGKAGISDGE